MERRVALEEFVEGKEGEIVDFGDPPGKEH